MNVYTDVNEEYDEYCQTIRQVSIRHTIRGFELENFNRIRFIIPSEQMTLNELNEPKNQYLPFCIETYKTFCESVNNVNKLKITELNTLENILEFRQVLEQSKTLFTGLNRERLQLETEYSRVVTSFKIPSKTLLNNVEYESFHNEQVTCMSQFMMSSCITEIKLYQIKMYLDMIKTQIQEMTKQNHHIKINTKRKRENPHCLNI